MIDPTVTSPTDQPTTVTPVQHAPAGRAVLRHTWVFAAVVWPAATYYLGYAAATTL